MIERGKDSEGVNECRYLFRVAADSFEIENAFTNFSEEVVVVVHLFNDFDEVGNELIFDSVVAWVYARVPRTAPMRYILLAAFSLREGLSLFSS